jgi:hypothetical protein
VQTVDPDRAKERVDQWVTLRAARHQQRHPKGEERVERQEGRRAERNAEQNGLARHVLAHPAPLRRELAGPELAMGVEKSRVEDRHGIDGEPVALGELRKLGPGQVGVGRFVVEVEPDGGGCHS